MIECADRLDFLRKQPDDSVDLVFFSPPYEDCRTYGINFALKGQAWVDFMVETWRECNRVCKGLVAAVVEGKTKQFRWSATPALLMADLHRAGMKLRKPPAFHRVGIPGSGGPDWLRNDYEFIVCTSRGKLPWSENTAMGKICRFEPGGAMSYRNGDGVRKNARGYSALGRALGRGRNVDGTPKRKGQNGTPMRFKNAKRAPDKANKREFDEQLYIPPQLANPGNVVRCSVGGGVMGDDLCHENEAPFPESLAEFFIRSFCPPGGLVCDCFSGSGTTLAVALRCNRRAIGCDIRQSQVDLTQRRLVTIQRELFV